MGKKKLFVNRKIELRAKEANYKEYSLECSTVYSRELETNASNKMLEAFEMWSVDVVEDAANQLDREGDKRRGAGMFQQN